MTAAISGVLLATAVCLGQTQVGIVVAVQGEVTAVGVNGAARVLQIRSPVFFKDRITTRTGAKLQILFDDDSVVSQGESGDLTVDEYVYDAKRKEDAKCSLNMAKGMFRVVTGKITEMNPERFKVRTRTATIGIRGCEVGFRIDQLEEHVFIVELPRGLRIVIERADVGQRIVERGRIRGGELLEVLKAGVVVVLREGARMQQRRMSAEEARTLIFGTALGTRPAGPPLTGPGGRPEGLPEGLAGMGPTPAGGRSMAGEDTTQDIVEKIRTISADESSDLNVRNLNEDVLIARQRLTTVTPPTPSRSAPPEPPPVQPPVQPENLFVEQGSGADWSWGTWEDPGRRVFDVEVRSGSVLADAAVQTLDGLWDTTRTLTGTGDAGAVIRHGDSTAYVRGRSGMEVQLGGGTVPTWGGSLDMHNTSGDALRVQLDGTIIGGQLLGGSTSYALNVNGRNFGKSDIASEAIRANLVGPGPNGSGRPEISGIIGTFDQTLLRAEERATVRGVWGADLNRSLR